jgi:hypothetical protein
MSEALIKPKRKLTSGGKVRISLDLDPAVLAYYKAQAGDSDFKELINRVLKANISAGNASKRVERVRALRGKYAHVQTNSEQFALRKQEEIELEG